MSNLASIISDEDHVKILQTKNKALENQLDKVTDDLFKAQEIATDLKNQIEEQKHSEQLGGWAIDRAIESLKLVPEQNATGSVNEVVIRIAHSYTKWIKDTSAVSRETKGVKS